MIYSLFQPALDFCTHLLAFILTLSPLVIIHEFGHYCMARFFGVHVESFSLGFGPQLFSWTDRRGTEWKICLWFLGGYVKILGEPIAPSEKQRAASTKISNKDLDKTLLGKAPWQKILIYIAGPAMNYLLAFIMLFGLFILRGAEVYDPVIGQIVAQSPAERGGLRPGDRIVSIDGTQIADFEKIFDLLSRKSLSDALNFTIQRNDDMANLSIESPQPSAQGAWIGRLGIAPDPAAFSLESLSAVGSIVRSGLLIKELSVAPMKMLFAGRFEGMSGPLGIAQKAGQAVRGGLSASLFFMASLSVGLGFFNLLPIPLLDGGGVVFSILEGLKGKPLSQRFQQVVSIVAIVFLGIFLIYFSLKDLLRISLVSKILSPLLS